MSDIDDWPEPALRALSAVLPLAIAVRRADPGRRFGMGFSFDGELGDLVVTVADADQAAETDDG